MQMRRVGSAVANPEQMDTDAATASVSDAAADAGSTCQPSAADTSLLQVVSILVAVTTEIEHT